MVDDFAVPVRTLPGNTRKLGWLKWLMVVLCAFSYGWYIVQSPRVALLIPDSQTRWLQPDLEFFPGIHKPGNLTVEFRTVLMLSTPLDSSTFSVRSLGPCAVELNGQRLPQINAPSNWKENHDFLTPPLGAGQHRLAIVAKNNVGPCLICPSSPAFLMSDSSHWLAVVGGQFSVKVIDANTPRTPPVATELTSNTVHISRAIVIDSACWLICFLLLYRGLPNPEESPSSAKPGRVRWILLALWMVISLNNVRKVPDYIGYDAAAHLEYIRFVADHWDIPHPSEGWQFFQPPLYYFVSAVLYKAMFAHVSAHGMERSLHVVPVASGLVLIDLTFRIARRCFPARIDLQILAVIAGAFLPMSLYMSSVLSNEPLNAVMIALLVLFAIASYQASTSQAAFGWSVACAVALGLALLTKTSALILIPPIGVILAMAFWKTSRSASQLMLKMAGCAVCLMLVCGYYFAVQWHRVGTPIVNGWDASRISWWQDPGYRTLPNLYRFGRSLIQPIYAGTWGVWDSLYSSCWADGYLSGMFSLKSRPPWNYGFLFTGVWLALIPTFMSIWWAAGQLIGKSSSRNPKSFESIVPLRFCAICLLIFIAAIFHMFLTLPIYACAKSSYMLGLVPCLAVLIAAGYDQLPQNRILRAGMASLIVTGAFNAYLTFFVV